ncbi:MAG: hypothetical protein NC489_41425 [Ruminococcus flavefaciens]|nr:hypothetical protein [Ruminococcus flavefaciens]
MGLLIYVCFWYIYLIFMTLYLKLGLSIIYREFFSRKDVSDEEKQAVWEKNSLILAKWNFCVYLFFMCITSFGMLYWITNKYGSYRIVQSGLIVPIWLFLSGILIRKIYFFLGRKSSVYIWIDKSFDEKQMKIYWIMIPVISSLVYLMYNFNLVLMIIAIIIGKYLWLDTIIDMREIKHKIKALIVENKDSLEIIFLFALYAIGGGISFLLYRLFLFEKGYTSVLLFLPYTIIMCMIISLGIAYVLLKYYEK